MPHSQQNNRPVASFPSVAYTSSGMCAARAASTSDANTPNYTLSASSANIIVLQELSPQQANAILRDDRLMQQYPHHILRPDNGSRGMALLSIYPIVEQGDSMQPNVQWARLQVDEKQTIIVANAHPQASRILAWGDLPIVYGYDPAERDQQLARVRALIAPFLEDDDPLLLVGDFNVTEREPAYHDLTAGLTDAHAAVGWGMGNTWRGRPHWPFGVLRIDYLFNNEQLIPIDITTDCTRRGSDHCIVSGTFAIR